MNGDDGKRGNYGSCGYLMICHGNNQIVLLTKRLFICKKKVLFCLEFRQIYDTISFYIEFTHPNTIVPNLHLNLLLNLQFSTVAFIFILFFNVPFAINISKKKTTIKIQSNQQQQNSSISKLAKKKKNNSQQTKEDKQEAGSWSKEKK